MRFVVPETKRIDLADGPNGEKNWIEIKKELTKAEDAAFRTRAFKRAYASGEGGTMGAASSLEIDWKVLSLARVEAYLVDWSARQVDGKPVAVTPSAIGGLAPESFDEIDAAIQAHIAELDEEKKARSGGRALATS